MSKPRGRTLFLGAVASVWAASLAGLPAAEGLTVFSRGVMQDVGEADAPKPQERLDRVDLRALRGEYEPFTFAIHNDTPEPLPLEAQMAPFVHETDRAKSIPAQEIEIHGLRKGAQLRRRKVKDWVLYDAGRATAAPGKTARFWITVRVPEDAAPGAYRSTLSVTGGGKKAALPVTLRVSKAVARPVPGVHFYLLSTISHYGQYFRNLKPADRARLKPKVVEFYRELKAHGMTGMAVKCSDYPYKEGRIEGLIAEVEAGLEAGLKGPIVWNMQALIDAAKGGDRYDFNGRCDKWDEKKDLARLKKLHELSQKVAKEKGWPEIVYYPIDEPGTQTNLRKFLYLRMEILEKTARTLKELGARSHSTITESVDEKHNRAPRWSRTPDEMRKIWDRCRPYLGIRNYGYGYPQGKTNLRHEIADAKKRGHEVWIYNNAAIMGVNRFAARTYFGLWGWKVGVQGLTAWTYPGGRTVQFELAREGIDDYKALAVLEGLIREKAGAKEDRAAAASFLEKLKEGVKLNQDGFMGEWVQVAQMAHEVEKLGPGWKIADYADLKARFVDFIDRLHP